ncbi:UNVERIFIED_ORG: hypothetical protein LHJ69_20250 [Shinella sp. XGS7]|nr:hypothetical protein [Shinella sp. XGS7]
MTKQSSGGLFSPPSSFHTPHAASAARALRPLALAAMLLCLGAPLQAQISYGGAINVWPDNLPPESGELGNNGLFVGNGGVGWLDVAQGAQLNTGSLLIGPSATGNGNGLVTLRGAGTLVRLQGDGFSDGVINRLGVGEWGYGALTVSDGAVLDGRANATACLGQFHYCNTFIANAAGSTGVFTVSGAGSQASFLRGFYVGGLAVFHPPVDSFSFGTPGGTSSGTVKVLNGAQLNTERTSLGLAPGGGSPSGSERSFAEVLIDGPGSVWKVGGGSLEPSEALMSTASHRNAWVNLTISQGGVLRFEGGVGRFSGLNLTQNGGRSDMLVTGAGSRLEFLSDAGVLQVGRALGTASLALRDGAQASGLFYASVGRDAAFGELSVSGAGSLLLINGTASAAANGTANGAAMDIGRGGGRGVVTISDGGQIHLLADQAQPGGMSLNLGRDANSAGTLHIQGAGSVLRMQSLSVLPGGGAGESLNPTLRVGRDGVGTLNITAGGQLLLEGGAVSTPAHRRSTSLIIGGLNDSSSGGFGIATVSGAGSEIRLSGGDTFIGVGLGPQSSGQLTVADGGRVSAIGMSVGRSGGVGLLKVDSASLSFSGQQTAGNQSGAFLTVGTGGSVGVASIANGSRVTLSNAGSAGAGLSLGGSGAFPGGDGSLTLSGGSRIQVQAAPGLGVVTIGREGSGLLRMKGASSLDVGDGQLILGRLSGSDGTLIASEGSSVSAGWVGVGRSRSNGVDQDGGSGTLILVNSTLTAQDIVIGSKGFLCGTGTISGNVTNHGIFCPGNSPGTVRLNGDYRTAAGGRMVLEVQDAGGGQYLTDAVVFGGAVDLAGLQIEFRFLGATDPTAFRNSGKFDIDTFLGRDNGAGGLQSLGDASFKNVSFSASAEGYVFSSFSYDAASGASFTAQAVPEPQHWALLLAGLGFLALRARGQRRAALG